MLQRPRAGAIRPGRSGQIRPLRQDSNALAAAQNGYWKAGARGGQGANRPSQPQAPFAAGIAAMRLVLGRAMTQPPPMGSQPLAKARAAVACRWFRAGTALPPPRG